MTEGKITTLLAVDVGAKLCGYTITKNGSPQLCGFFHTESYTNFFKTIDQLCYTWLPDMLIVGKPNRFYNVIASHNRYVGVLCLLGEKFQIPLIEINDVTARHVVMPEVKATDKKFFHEKFLASDHNIPPIISQEDALDSTILAIGWHLLSK